MDRKNHIKLLSLGFFSLLLISGIGFLYNDSDDIVDKKIFNEESKFTEKIPLYYSLDAPEIIYTKNELGEFEEIKIND